MADTIHKVSDRMIDWAVRLENVSDAAKGKAVRRRSPGTRWLLLPAAGAGLYALATSGAFSRQAKDVMDQAKTRASELPDDLMGRLRQTTQKSSQTTQKSTGNAGRGRRQQTTKARKPSTRRKTDRRSR
jgi:hypothetical protein